MWPALQEMVRRDLEQLRNVAEVKAYVVTSYFCSKYRLVNREVLQFTGNESMEHAERQGSRPAQPRADREKGSDMPNHGDYGQRDHKARKRVGFVTGRMEAESEELGGVNYHPD